jgi:hypothetical protein
MDQHPQEPGVSPYELRSHAAGPKRLVRAGGEGLELNDDLAIDVGVLGKNYERCG